MRKKLFAVIMSAMMMITFMPAMAFAAVKPIDQVSVTPTPDRFTVSGFTTELSSGDLASYIYDGTEHTVTYNPGTVTAGLFTQKLYKYVTYTVAYKPATVSTFTAPKEYNTSTAPVVKDAGVYDIYAKVNCPASEGASFTAYLRLVVAQRPVSVTSNTLVKTLAYTGNQYTLTDADLAISTFTGNIKGEWVVGESYGWIIKNVGHGRKAFTYAKELVSHKYVPTDYEYGFAWNDAPSAAWQTAHSGLVAGDKLLVSEVKTQSANVGEYDIKLSAAKINPNYFVASQTGGNFKVVITKADNVAKIASNTLTIKRGSFKAVKFSTTFGTAKLEKVSTGNTKISVKNGKVYVKKGLKKGTYKIQVKCSAAGNENYASAARTKTLKIKVK